MVEGVNVDARPPGGGDRHPQPRTLPQFLVEVPDERVPLAVRGHVGEHIPYSLGRGIDLGLGPDLPHQGPMVLGVIRS